MTSVQGPGDIMISLLANGTTFWTVAAIGLAGLVAHQITDERPAAPDVGAAPVKAAADDGTPETPAVVEFPSEDLIDEIVARPLFSASRRPPPPELTAGSVAATPPDDKPTLELIGTMLAGDDHIALLKHPTDGLLRLRPGESVGGWTIVDVQNQLVSLEDGDGLEVLTLRKDQVRPKAPRAAKNSGQARKTNEEPDEEEPEPTSAPIRRPI